MEYVSLANDIMFEIMIHADYDDILSYSVTSKTAWKICNQEILWRLKAHRILNLSNDLFDSEFGDFQLTPKQRYLELMSHRGIVGKGSENFIGLNKFVTTAIQMNRPDLVDYGISIGYNNMSELTYLWGVELNIPQLNIYLKLSNNFQKAAEGVLHGGSLHLFTQLYLSQKYYFWNYLNLLNHSCLSGNIDLVIYITQITPPDIVVNWETLLYTSVISTNVNLVNHILKKLPNYSNWNKLAADSVISEAVFWNILNIGPSNHVWDWNLLINETLFKGSLSLIQNFLIKNFHLGLINQTYANLIINTFTESIRIKYLVEYLNTNKYKWTNVLCRAISISRQLFTDVINFVPIDVDIDWDKIILYSILSDNSKYIKNFMNLNITLNNINTIDKTLINNAINVNKFKYIYSNSYFSNELIYPNAILGGKFKYVLDILDSIGTYINWKILLEYTLKSNNGLMMKYILSKSLSNVFEISETLINYLIISQNIQMIKMVIEFFNWELIVIKIIESSNFYLFTQLLPILNDMGSDMDRIKLLLEYNISSVSFQKYGTQLINEYIGL